MVLSVELMPGRREKDNRMTIVDPGYSGAWEIFTVVTGGKAIQRGRWNWKPRGEAAGSGTPKG